MSVYKPIIPSDGRSLRLVGAFIRRTNLDRASLRGADLSRADLTGATARDADFKGAVLEKTILKGVDMTGAKNLSVEQLAEAVIDENTRLPEYIDRAVLKQRMRTSRGKLL